jgi:hypothetical protein
LLRRTGSIWANSLTKQPEGTAGDADDCRQRISLMSTLVG